MQFSYDGLKRLSSAYYPNVPQTLSWTYDRYGNRISQSGTPGFGSVIDANTNRFSTIGGVTAVYDANGNMTYDPSGGGYSYAWDAENRLVTVNPSIPTATYVYEADSLRTQRTHGGTTYTTIYDGARELAEYTGGALSVEHVYGPDGKLAKFEGGTLKYFVNDHLSRRDLLDTSGNLITNAAQGHYPFGEDWYGNSTEQFTSYERDPESENDYAIFRHYSPRQGRFVSPDPLQGVISNPQSLNRYAYVLDDPVNWFDPLGLSNCDPEDYHPIACAEELRRRALDSINRWWKKMLVRRQRLGRLDGKGDPHGSHSIIPEGMGPVEVIACGSGSIPMNLARVWNRTISIGIGGNATLGALVGKTVAANFSIVADPTGKIGITFTTSNNENNVGAFGASAQVGVVASRTDKGKTISDVAGRSMGMSAGMSGFTGEVNKGSTATTTGVTIGPGIGGKAAGGYTSTTYVLGVVNCGFPSVN